MRKACRVPLVVVGSFALGVGLVAAGCGGGGSSDNGLGNLTVPTVDSGASAPAVDAGGGGAGGPVDAVTATDGVSAAPDASSGDGSQASDVADATPGSPDAVDAAGPIDGGEPPAPDGTTGDAAADGGIDAPAPGTCSTGDDCPGWQPCEASACVEPPICLAQADCQAGHVCSRYQCVGTPLGCTQSSDCERGECNPLLQACSDAAPCSTDLDCVTGRCDPASDSCVACLEPADCPNPVTQACLDGACVEPTPCTEDGDCLDGRVCSNGSCGPPAVAPDAYEPNDEDTAAASVAEGEVTGLTLGADDVDWFAWEVPAGLTPVIRLDADVAHARAELALVDPATSTVVSLDDAGGPAALVGAPASPAKPRTWLIRVRPLDGWVSSYSLRLWASPKLACVTDLFDRVVVNNQASAATGVSGDRAQFEGLTICPNDEDWFVLNPSQTFDLDVSISYPLDLPGTLEVALVDSDGNEVDNALGAAGAVSLSAKELAATTWYVRVRGTQPDVHLGYSLSIDTKAKGACVDDGYDNDVPLKAVPLEPGVHGDLVLCPGDEDWYSIDVPAGYRASITLAYDATPAGLHAVLLAENLTDVLDEDPGPSDAGAGFVSVELKADNEGFSPMTAALHIAAGTAFGEDPIVPYSLAVVVEPIPCEDDVYETDNEPSAAHVAKPGELLPAALCPQQDVGDWWAVDLAPGDAFALSVSHPYDLDGQAPAVLLYDPTAAVPLAVGKAQPITGATLLRMSAVPSWWPAGTYLALVTGKYEGPYALAFERGVPQECGAWANGPEEPDGAPGSATLMPSSGGSADAQLVLCAGDTDYVVVPVDPVAPMLEVSAGAQADASDPKVEVAYTTALGEVLDSAPVPVGPPQPVLSIPLGADWPNEFPIYLRFTAKAPAIVDLHTQPSP